MAHSHAEEQTGPAGAEPATTPLDALHRELGARMVEFAGYAMPVNYPAGIKAEHLHCRAEASLFDVSHMGQARLVGPDAAARLERVIPSDLQNLAPGRMRYTVLLAESGGIIDDLMIYELETGFHLVLNAACKQVDSAYLNDWLGPDLALEPRPELALLALQGPRAAEVLAAELGEQGDPGDLVFLRHRSAWWQGTELLISRSGYTGEDGFEIAVPAERAEPLARALLAHEAVAPAGLGARDSLRLEAGLCLYGFDLDETTSPIEAGLGWVIQKNRRARADFVGAERILAEIEAGPARKRVGLRPEGRAPARAGTEIRDKSGAAVGTVSSGGYGPSLAAPMAMGYVRADLARPDTELDLMLRGRAHPARVARLPFLPHKYVFA